MMLRTVAALSHCGFFNSHMAHWNDCLAKTTHVQTVQSARWPMCNTMQTAPLSRGLQGCDGDVSKSAFSISEHGKAGE